MRKVDNKVKNKCEDFYESNIGDNYKYTKSY